MAKNEENKNKAPNPSATNVGPSETNAENTAQNTGNSGDEGSKKKGTVEVDATFLKDLMDKMKKLEESNEMLIKIADKGRLSKYELDHAAQDVVKTALMSFYDDKPVVAWRMVQDEVYIDGRGIYHETQIVELTFEDGSKVQVSLLDSARRMKKVTGEIINRSKDEYGNEIVDLLLGDGKQFSLDIRFIN